MVVIVFIKYFYKFYNKIQINNTIIMIRRKIYYERRIFKSQDGLGIQVDVF